MVRPLGKGGTAEVYEVRHADGRRAALKRLMDPEPAAVARLRREAVALTTLVHPHVVQLIDVIDDGEHCALLLELVQGPSLAERVHEPDLTAVEELFLGVLDGVSAAHAAGWVHRDLKPGNVLLELEGGNVVPKVADFGLAHVLVPHTRLTQTGAFMGTPAYMAPEQVRDPSGAGVPADVFSLGALLYELCTGRPPFVASDVLAVLHAAAHGLFPHPSTLRPELPERFVAAIVGALQPDPALRIGDCATLRQVLTGRRPWRVREPMVDVPPTMATASQGADTQAQPRRGRRPWGWVVGVAGLVGAAVVGAVGWSQGSVAEPPTISDDPETQAAFVQAHERWAAADFDGAVRLLSAVRRRTDGVPAVSTLLGVVEACRQRSEEAVDHLSAARADTSPDQVALRALVDALLTDLGGQDDTVWIELSRAHGGEWLVDPVACMQLGWGSDADRICARAARAHPGMAVLDWGRAEGALDYWEWGVAEHHAKALLTLHPEHPLGLAALGRVRAAEGAWPEAQALAQRALASDPTSVDAHGLLARAALNLGDAQRGRQGYRALMSDAHALADRVRATESLAFTELGLGRAASGEEAFAEMSEVVLQARAWDLLAHLQVRRGLFGWYLQDPDIMQRARAQMVEALAAPEVSATVAQPMRASSVYMAGLEAALRGDPEGARAARQRLEASDVASVAWLDRVSAIGVLTAYEERLRGRPDALLHLARTYGTCESLALGADVLLDEGFAVEAEAQWRRVLQECPPSGMGQHFRYLAAHRLAGRAAASGDAEAEARHRAQLAEIWPDPDPNHPLVRRERASEGSWEP
ncbi:MAG: serine/threonine protein kinase [Myxococcales bacterium]|nr:serine/threonine protein kinase [Myxococcales bacterium]